MKDLEIFRKAFLSDKVKHIPNGLYYHGQDMDSALQIAKNIIKEKGLNLIARTTGNMAQFRRFEVVINN